MKIKFSPESGGFGECAVVQKYRQRQNTHTHTELGRVREFTKFQTIKNMKHKDCGKEKQKGHTEN